MNLAQLLRLVRGGRGSPAPVPVILPPSIASTTPGVFQAGVALTFTAASVPGHPEAAIASPQLLLEGTNAPVAGATGSGYTPTDADVGASVFLRDLVTVGGVSYPVDGDVVGPIAARPVAGAPVVANQPLDFGRLTSAGMGAAPVINTGGAITSAAIVSGTNANHWQISADGKLSPSGAGVAAGLSATYGLTCSFSNVNGSVNAVITINTEANALDVATAAEMSAATTALGTISSPTTIYVRPGADLPWSTTWFNDRGHTALLTVKARVRRTATFSGIGPSTKASGWSNLAFSGLKFSAKFKRNLSGPAGVWLWRGTIGLVDFYDCDLAGDLSSMSPGAHYWGFIYVSNTADTNMNNADLRWRSCDIHGISRLLLASNARNDVSPGPKIQVTDCDAWDMGIDGLYMAGYWQRALVQNNYIHSAYINAKRVSFPSTAAKAWKRTLPWAGAVNGKKLFMLWRGDWQYNTTANGNRTIYGEGDPTAPAIKLWRDGAGKINAVLRDTSGAVVATLQSARTYSYSTTGGVPQMMVALSVDTDRDAQLHIWLEADGGGGAWVESLSAPTAGQTLHLTAGQAGFSAMYDGSDCGRTTGFDMMYCERFAIWPGQAPNLAGVHGDLISDVTGLMPAFSTLTPTYGQPVVYMEGTFAEWNANGNIGTGGQWSSLPASATLDHGDMIQSAFNSTVTDVQIRCNDIFSDIDVSAKYVRPLDPTGAFNYRSQQGYFGEDMNSGHYNDGVVVEGNVVCIGEGHGISPYNGRNGFIVGNTVIAIPEWGFTSTGWPLARFLQNGTAPSSGNTIADNFAYAVSSYGAGDVTTPNVTGYSPSTHSAVIAAGAAPTNRAELLAYVAPKAGQALLTGLLKAGAVATYFDRSTGVADHPRTNTCPGFAVTDVVGATPGATVTSAATLVSGIVKSDALPSVNGGLVQVSGGASTQLRITSDAGGSSIVTDWTSSPAVIQNGQHLWIRQTAPVSGLTSDVLVRVGRSADAWSVTSA